VPILSAGVPVVEVKIGGKGPYRFAVDTGAQGHGRITPQLAEELGLAKVGEVRAPGAGGTVTTRPVFAAPEVSVGKVSFKNLDLVALPALRGLGEQWDGVLGNELLKLIALTLDYGNARVRLGGVELSEGLPARFDHGVPILPIDIAGKRFQVHFDSGNGAAALFLDEPVESARARTTFGEFAVNEVPLAASVTIDGAPLSVRAVGWPSPRPDGNLGSRAMAGMSVTIDAASQLVEVKPSGRAPRCPE
jgi:predicted aspartyl protease